MIKATRKVLIIGGAGFIGSHLCEELLRLGNKVVIIDNFSTSAIKKLPAKIYKADIENFNKVKDIFRKEKPDIVYHLAGAINLRRSIRDPLFKKSSNVLGRTKIILDCCLRNKVKKIIFFSSGGAIKKAPTSLYALANLMIEKYIELYGLDYVILRLSNVYGARQWEKGIIPRIINNLLKNKSPVIYDDGTQARDFVYIDDVVETAILAINAKPGVYNIAQGQEVSINQLFQMISQILNSKIKPIHRKRSERGVKKKDFSWQPKTNFKEGLLKTVEWFKK